MLSICNRGSNQMSSHTQLNFTRNKTLQWNSSCKQHEPNLNTGEIFALWDLMVQENLPHSKCCGLVQPTAGEISVLGLDVQKDPVAVKRQVGYVPESPEIYEFLTGIEYLDFIGDIYGMPNVEKQQRITSTSRRSAWGKRRRHDKTVIQTAWKRKSV